MTTMLVAGVNVGVAPVSVKVPAVLNDRAGKMATPFDPVVALLPDKGTGGFVLSVTATLAAGWPAASRAITDAAGNMTDDTLELLGWLTKNRLGVPVIAATVSVRLRVARCAAES